MFGLGGIFVEVLKAVSFGVIPIDRRNAQKIIKDIKGYPLLQGYRVREPVNIPAIVEMILEISNLINEKPRIKEVELNPYFLTEVERLLLMPELSLEKVKRNGLIQ